MNAAGRSATRPIPRSHENISLRSGSKITPATISPGLFQRQGDVVHREAVREIRGAVQRIDVPAVFRRRARVPAALFGHDGVRGEMRVQPLDHQLLGGAVGLGHQIELAFQLEADVALEIAGSSAPASRAISALISR